MSRRISFDLDDTLICYQPGVPQEPALSWRWRWLGGDEPLRRGAVGLLNGLRRAGWDVWVYTTSYRDPWSVRLWLWCHGVRVGRVINQDVHNAYFRGRGESPPSKHPGAFGIDLHVDDSVGVLEEGRRHGFRVLVVSPGDLEWVRAVSQATGLRDG